MNNRAHLTRCDYTQQQLHLQYCIQYIFVKQSLHNFYSVARNSKIVSSCNFTLISSQNTEKKIWKLTFGTTLVNLLERFYHGLDVLHTANTSLQHIFPPAAFPVQTKNNILSAKFCTLFRFPPQANTFL